MNTSFINGFEAWISNPDNVNAITYSLAVVDQATSADTEYLTPQSMAFSVYASTDDNVGCLSVYIRAKDSGNSDGNTKRAFRLPNLGGENSYPIPENYDASIIIRHENFSKFLDKAIHNTKQSDGKDFASVTQIPATTGFSYKIVLNDELVKQISDPITSPWDIQVGSIRWSLADSPLTLTTSSMGVATWKMSFPEKRIPWSSTLNPERAGSVYFSVDVSKNVKLTDTDQSKIYAKIEITSSDYQKHITQSGSSAPSSILSPLSQWSLPAFSGGFRLDFFATTNVFAPDRQIIDIDTTQGVMTPYDVLLVGHIIGADRRIPL